MEAGICLEGYISDAACKNDASVISLNLQSKFFVEKHSSVQELILLLSLVASSVIRTVKHLLFMNKGQIHF